MLAKRVTVIVTGKESCEGIIIRSTFLFWLLRESLACAWGARRGTVCPFGLSAALQVGRASHSQCTF